MLVKQGAIEVFRDPDPAAGSYRTRFTVSRDSTVTPAALAGPAVRAGALSD